ncbi:unnamed protein product [Peniophora sp. CBMAI 1063]|nr:unnamed protein product [Peniophora sp. CBMAI 1063]
MAPLLSLLGKRQREDDEQDDPARKRSRTTWSKPLRELASNVVKRLCKAKFQLGSRLWRDAATGWPCGYAPHSRIAHQKLIPVTPSRDATQSVVLKVTDTPVPVDDDSYVPASGHENTPAPQSETTRKADQVLSDLRTIMERDVGQNKPEVVAFSLRAMLDVRASSETAGRSFHDEPEAVDAFCRILCAGDRPPSPQDFAQAFLGYKERDPNLCRTHRNPRERDDLLSEVYIVFLALHGANMDELERRCGESARGATDPSGRTWDDLKQQYRHQGDGDLWTLYEEAVNNTQERIREGSWERRRTRVVASTFVRRTTSNTPSDQATRRCALPAVDTEQVRLDWWRTYMPYLSLGLELSRRQLNNIPDGEKKWELYIGQSVRGTELRHHEKKAPLNWKRKRMLIDVLLHLLDLTRRDTEPSDIMLGTVVQIWRPEPHQIPPGWNEAMFVHQVTTTIEATIIHIVTRVHMRNFPLSSNVDRNPFRSRFAQERQIILERIHEIERRIPAAVEGLLQHVDNPEQYDRDEIGADWRARQVWEARKCGPLAGLFFANHVPGLLPGVDMRKLTQKVSVDEEVFTCDGRRSHIERIIPLRPYRKDVGSPVQHVHIEVQPHGSRRWRFVFFRMVEGTREDLAHWDSSSHSDEEEETLWLLARKHRTITQAALTARLSPSAFPRPARFAACIGSSPETGIPATLRAISSNEMEGTNYGVERPTDNRQYYMLQMDLAPGVWPGSHRGPPVRLCHLFPRKAGRGNPSRERCYRFSVLRYYDASYPRKYRPCVVYIARGRLNAAFRPADGREEFPEPFLSLPVRLDCDSLYDALPSGTSVWQPRCEGRANGDAYPDELDLGKVSAVADDTRKIIHHVIQRSALL